MDAFAHHSQWLTPARLQHVLGIGETTELEWRRRRVIPFFKCGRLIRYDPAAVLEFLRRHTVRARGAGAGCAGPDPGFSAEQWARVARLIEDQVRAQLAGGREAGAGERLAA